MENRKVVLYSRVAEENNLALDQQMTALREYAKQNNLVVVDEICDVGSAAVLERAGMKTVLKLAKEKAFDALLVASWDRLSRKIEETAVVFAFLDDANIDIISVRESSQNLRSMLSMFNVTCGGWNIC